MRKTIKLAAVFVMMSVVFLFAGCADTPVEDAPITSTWHFTYIESDDMSYTEQEWISINELDPSEATPIPEFRCIDEENCVLQFNGNEHEGVITHNNDGTYSIANPGTSQIWGTVTIEGNDLHLVLGNNTARLDFSKVS